MSLTLHQRSSLVEILQQRVTEQPHKTAYIFLQDGESPSEQLTYQELDRQARKIAYYCQFIIPQGERALLLYPPSLEFAAAFFGCLYAEIVAVPVYPPKRNQKLSRLLTIVRDSQATVVLTTEMVKQDWQHRQSEPMLNKLRWIATDKIEADPLDWSPPLPARDRLALLQYTSGSIGKPKGVMVSHRNLMHNLKMIHACFGHDPSTVGITWLPHYHDMGLVGGVLQSVYEGFVVIIMPPVAFVRKPIRWLQAMSRYQATASGGPNFAYDLCVAKIKPEQLAELDLSHWRLAFMGAEPIRAETVNNFARTFAPCGFKAKAFNPCYGLAESTLFVSGCQLKSVPTVKWIDARALRENKVMDAVANSPNSRAIVSCGYSWSEQQFWIVEPQSHQILPERLVGEIWIKGNSVASGYWNRERQTQATFDARLSNGSGSYLRTGDLGFVLDGNLYVTGRLKDVIIIRGRNHYPQDIELTAQKSHSALRADCGAVFALETEEQQLVLVQEVERSYIRNLDVDRIASQINRAILAEHELSINTIMLIKTGSIAKTSSGKIKRRACREDYLQGELNIVGQWQRQSSNTSATSRWETQSNNADGINRWLKQWLANKLALDVRAIQEDAAFADYGMDSVMSVELIQDLEDWLQFALDPNLVWDFPNLDSLGAYLAERISLQQSSEVEDVSPAVNLATEAVLDSDIKATSILKPSSSQPQAILLTGATGFLGAFLLSQLLQQTESHIYCLVRATDADSGKTRIKANLAAYKLWQKDYSDRIIPIVGDLSQPNLGLTATRFQTLAERIDVIYHNGALVNYVYSYKLLKPTNVLGTESILRLACLNKLKPVHYISSTAVFDCHTPALKQTIVTESDFVKSPTGMYLDYSQSKWVADRMMQTARDRGLMVCIYRPGLIGGHSVTGIANGEDIIWRILTGSIQMGYLPKIDLNLDLTPVDYVSQNIVALSRQNELNNQTFHLNHPHSIPWNRVIEFVRAAGYLVQFVTLEQWLEKIATLVRSNRNNPLYPLIPFLLNRQANNSTILELMQAIESPQVNCDRTIQQLARLDNAIACPALDRELWQIYLDYFKHDLLELNSIDSKLND